MIIRLIFILSLFIVLYFKSFADNIMILSFIPERAETLSPYVPIEDSNGDICAVVKIDIPVAGCKFSGFVVNSQYINDSYILNVSVQSRKIVIKCPGYDICSIDISNFPDKKPLLSGEKYHIVVDMNGANTMDDGGNFAVFNLIPNDLQNARLVINNKTYDVKNGQVIDFLNYGQYSVTASAYGFQPKSETFIITPDKTTTVDIYLNSEMAKLFVECDIPGSTIFINGDKKSKNSWQSSLPEGDYLVEVTRVGYKTHSELIHLKKKETKNLKITLQDRYYTIDDY